MNNMTHEKAQWCIDQHVKTNHFYDEYLPYEFHLRMAILEYHAWKCLLPKNMYVDKTGTLIVDRTFEVIELSVWGHDLIEDVRKTYNDLIKNLSVGYSLDTAVAEICRACTNYGRGRNRRERMPDFCYEDIRNTPGATFVKLCDRIANVKFGIMTKSSQVKNYKKENEHFLKMLQGEELTMLIPMVDYLNNLFETKI